MDAENIVNFGRKVCNETWGFFLNVQAIHHSTKVWLTRFTLFSETQLGDNHEGGNETSQV